MSNKKSNIFVYLTLVAAVLLTKVLGLLRGVIMSAAYGTGIEASAFTAVSNLPLNIFDVTFSTAITSAFVPVFNEKLSSEGKESANRFASNFFNIIFSFSVVIVLLCVAFPKQAVMLVASGFGSNGEAMNIAVTLMRIIAPIISFACCTFTFIGVLQSYEEFIAPALVSLLSNLTMIIYLLFFNSSFGINGLAVAFTLGWLLQFVFLLPFLRKKKFRYSFGFDFLSKDIKKVALLTLPLFVASLSNPINQIISSNFSSRVSENGIATVGYAYTAYLIVAGVFSYALTNMFFPKMSRKFAQKDIEGATLICKGMLSSITAIILPIMVFLGTCSQPVIKLLYQRGEFSEADTINVSALLSIYAVGMIALSFQDILNKYFYSMQNSIVPMIAAGVGIVTNISLSFVLTPIIGLKGLAAATVIAGFATVLVLALSSLKFSKKIFTGDFWAELLKLIVCSAGSFGICKILLQVFDFNSSFIMQVIFILIILILSLIIYVVLMLVLKSSNISQIKSILKKGEEETDV